MPIGSVLFKQGKSYMIGGCPSGGAFNTYCQYIYGYTTRDTGTGLWYTHTTNDATINVGINLTKGITVNNLTFYPQVEIGNSKSPYVPFVDSIVLTVCGRNLVKNTATNQTESSGVSYVVNADKSVTVNGTPAGDRNIPIGEVDVRGFRGQKVCVKVNGLANNYMIYANAKKEDGTSLFTVIRDIDAINSSYIIPQDVKTLNLYIYLFSGITFTNKTFYPQLEIGSVGTPYETYKSQSATINTVTQKGWELLKSYLGVTNIIPSVPATINRTYVADTKLAYDKLKSAIVALGGNV